ncbi:MAG TPA: hypothetical protein VMV94_00045 [Phycisphaerae bacterium]|nr:hypothetical protein [Phycisphaerae bacterium]
MTTEPQPRPITEELYHELSLAVGYAILQRLLRDIASQALSPDQLVKYVRVYADLAKLDIARERIRADIEIAGIRADTAKYVADKRARSRDDDTQFTPDAPYGRKKDGTPYEFGEYLDNMTRAFRDIYGTKVDLRKDAEYFQSDAYKNAPWPNDVPAKRDDEDHDEPRDAAAPATQHSGLSTQHSQSSTQHSDPSTQHSAPSTQDSDPGTQHSGLSTQDSPPRRVQTFDSNPNPNFLVVPKRRTKWDLI